MFDFLKKSRAIRFLCSACLLCSLGSFDISAEDFFINADDAATSNVPVKVADAYLQGPLGFESNHITFEDDATITAGSGLMSDAALKWKETKTIETYSNSELTNQTLENAWANTPATDASTSYFKSANYTSETLDLPIGERYVIVDEANTNLASDYYSLEETLEKFRYNMEKKTPVNEKQKEIMGHFGWRYDEENGIYTKDGDNYDDRMMAWKTMVQALNAEQTIELIDLLGYRILEPNGTGHYTFWKDGTGNIVGSSANETNAREQAWTKLKTSITDQDTQKAIVLASGWKKDPDYKYSTLQNSDEDSKLALFLKSGDDYVGATKEIDLSELGEDRFTLKDVKFYNADAPAKIEDESAATPLSYKPGVYELHAILTDKGDKTLISGTDEDNSDES